MSEEERVADVSQAEAGSAEAPAGEEAGPTEGRCEPGAERRVGGAEVVPEAEVVEVAGTDATRCEGPISRRRRRVATLPAADTELLDVWRVLSWHIEKCG